MQAMGDEEEITDDLVEEMHDEDVESNPLISHHEDEEDVQDDIQDDVTEDMTEDVEAEQDLNDDSNQGWTEEVITYAIINRVSIKF